MSNSKISALTGATTPLAGTEVLPVVQSGTTKQVSVENLTAGREVNATRFSPTASTIPTNGMYLPASNTLGFAVNSGSSYMQLSTQALRVQITNDGSFKGQLVWAGGSVGGGFGTTFDTGISINQGAYGGTMLLLCSNNYGAGTQTRSAVYILNFYYDGNNVPGSAYLGGGFNSWTFSASGSNTLVITGPAGNNTYSFIGNK